MRSVPRFEMMHWAKRRGEGARIGLAASGVPAPDAGPELLVAEPSDPPPFSSVGNYWGDPRLRAAIAARHGIDREGVLVSDGASLANFNALAALAGPGERVLVESPTYPALAEIPQVVGARVERWARRPENAWLPSLEELRRALESGPPVRGVVLTRLHNPSGVDLPGSFLLELAALAEEHDFHVVLDEVYLDFVDATPGHRLSPRFLSTGSLTKVYGFGGLRVGWVLGRPEALAPVKELSFYLAVNGSTAAQSTALRIVRELDRFRDRGRALAARGRRVLTEWIEGRDDASWIEPAGGVCAFVHLANVSDTAAFATRLFDEHGVAVAEGELFDRPGWIRVAYGGEPDEVAEGLRRVGEVLDAYR